MTLLPLVIDGKVLVAASGGELGIRGFLAAYDAEKGQELWRTYSVPAPGEPGSETWPAEGDHYKRGGGTMWVTGNYDPETNLTFWGTGNAAPWFGDQATISTRRPSSPSMPTPVPSKGTFSITRTTRGTGMKSRRRS